MTIIHQIAWLGLAATALAGPEAVPVAVEAPEQLLVYFGTYTGGLSARDAAFDALLGPGARAYLTGERVTAVARDRLD